MDERELRELLRDAATSLRPSNIADLADRSQRRYRRRRVRARLLASAVVVAVVGSAVATAAMVVRSSARSGPTVAPLTSTTGEHRVSTTTTGVANGPIDVRDIAALSFVDKDVGFSLVNPPGTSTSTLVRTDDGGRTWRPQGLLGESENFVHFENESDGVAWGEGPLEITTDGGVHWREPAGGGPVDNYLTWAGGRLWSMEPCVQTAPCGVRSLLVSDDVGVTWRRTNPVQQQFGGAAVTAVSRLTAYVVQAATTPGLWQIIFTHDGGASWTYEPVPCWSGTQSPYLAANTNALMLVCAGQPGLGNQQKQVWTSTDGGRHWTAGSNLLGGDVGSITALGNNFVVGDSRADIYFSADDGHSWRIAIATVEAFPAIDSLPGVGAWVATGHADAHAGIWFSANGTDWELRASAAAPVPSSTAPTTTTTALPSVPRLLSALRSARFDGSDLPAHLHVVGVGPWQYVDAGHAGNGYVGSAQVSLRSDVSGESIDGIYDVFTIAAAASVSFDQAYANFAKYGPVGSFRVLKLNPPVRAFCAPQAAPANTTTCWFEQHSTTANVTATTPSASGSSDGQVVLQSMLTHLVVLGG